LKLLQGHSTTEDIKTTTKYAHVVDDEVAAGSDVMRKIPKKVPKAGAHGQLSLWMALE